MLPCTLIIVKTNLRFALFKCQVHNCNSTRDALENTLPNELQPDSR